jgi:dihydroflavonol-4-reductase
MLALAATKLTGKPPLLTPAAVAIARLGLAADASKARRELGWSPRPLDEAIRDALVWFSRQGYVRNGAARAAIRAIG